MIFKEELFMTFNNCKIFGVPAKYWDDFYLEWDDPAPDPEYENPCDDICWTTWRLFYWKDSDGKCYVQESHTGHTQGCFWTEDEAKEIELEDFCLALVNGFLEGMLVTSINK
jgi:hypothetical protein